MSSLFGDTEQLKRIGDMLEERFKKATPAPTPKAVQNYGNALQLYFGKLSVAYEEYALELERLEQYKGCQFYEKSEQAARGEYEDTAERAKSVVLEQLNEAVGQLGKNYVTLTQQSVPPEIMQQMQIFNMLKHPTAEQYEHYQNAFSGYPSAQEVLCNKFDEEAKPAKEFGKNGYDLPGEVVVSNGYLPKYASGVMFTPTRPLTYTKIKSILGRLITNAENILETNLPGDLAANEFILQGKYINSGIIRAVLKATTPEEIMSTVALSEDSEIIDFLKQTDKNYKPSTPLCIKSDEIQVTDVNSSTADSLAMRFVQQRADAAARREKIIDYYTKGTDAGDVQNSGFESAPDGDAD